MGTRPLPTLALVVVLMVGGCAEDRPAPRSTPAATRTFRLTVGTIPVNVRVAATWAERHQGLQGVRSLGEDEGLLLLYSDAKQRTIWMKGCRIALDVAFLDRDGRVLQVHTLQPPQRESATPEDADSPVPVNMVLELPGGFFRRHGLGPRTRVLVPPEVRGLPAD